MEIHVKDNAINSLEVGLQLYNKFLNNLNNIDISVTHYGNLKFSVIAIHNSIELLTKSILLDINEFLVFKSEVETDDILCGLLRDQYSRKKSKANLAYHAVFSTNSYKTIEYGKSILLLYKIFNDKLSKNNYETLKKLAEYRNTLTHLGYASTFEWYKILVVLNKSLELILEFYINNLIKAEEYFTKRIKNNIEKTLKKSKEHIEDIWIASNEWILDTINGILSECLGIEAVKINNAEIDTGYGYELYKKVNFTYNYKSEVVNLSWQFIYSYLNEAIVIIDDNNFIVGYISIDDCNITFSKDEDGIPNELKEIGILIPKSKVNYDKEKDYDLSNKSPNVRLNLSPDKFLIILNLYLKNIQKE
jgi:hypothetical protein